MSKSMSKRVTCAAHSQLQRRQLLLQIMRHQRIEDGIDVSLHHRRQIVKREFDAMIRHAVPSQSTSGRRRGGIERPRVIQWPKPPGPPGDTVQALAASNAGTAHVSYVSGGTECVLGTGLPSRLSVFQVPLWLRAPVGRGFFASASSRFRSRPSPPPAAGR